MGGTYVCGSTIEEDHDPGESLKKSRKKTREHRRKVTEYRELHQEELAAWKPDTWLIPRRGG